MANDIALVISTCDRYPAKNYLDQTLRNLTRSGVWLSDRLHSAHLLSDRRPDNELGAWPHREIFDLAYTLEHPGGRVTDARPLYVDIAKEPRFAQGNCAAALLAGGHSGAAWVLQIEDDIDVCDDFLGSVGRWLDRHASDDRPLYAFHGDHIAIQQAVKRGVASWEWAVHWFWGFQCFAVRSETAVDLARWYIDNPDYIHKDGRKDRYSHDIGVQIWAKERGYEWFRGSAPAFVQHIGIDRAVPYPSPKLVYFPSWPGREWVYR